MITQILSCLSPEVPLLHVSTEGWSLAKPQRPDVQPSPVISSATGVVGGIQPVMSWSGHPDSSWLLAGNNTTVPKGWQTKIGYFSVSDEFVKSSQS